MATALHSGYSGLAGDCSAVAYLINDLDPNSITLQVSRLVAQSPVVAIITLS